jgi:hypothetical protein
VSVEYKCKANSHKSQRDLRDLEDPLSAPNQKGMHQVLPKIFTKCHFRRQRSQKHQENLKNVISTLSIKIIHACRNQILNFPGVMSRRLYEDE